MKDKKLKTDLIEKLRKAPIIQAACEKIGIGRATFYRWKKADQEFSKMVDEAIKEGLLFVNDIAESQLMSAIKDKNMTAIIFWLKHHHSTYTSKLEISGNITAENKPLSPEQETLIKEALRLAGVAQKENNNQ